MVSYKEKVSAKKGDWIMPKTSKAGSDACPEQRVQQEMWRFTSEDD
jgi:hypothetical protein